MPKPYRTLAGFVAAWATAVVVAFLVGCVATLFMGNDAGQLLKAAAFGRKDALDIFLFIGGVSAMEAGVVAFLAAIFLAWPLHLILRTVQRVTLRLYLAIGFGIALAVSGILLILRNLIYDFPAGEEWFEYVAIFIIGPVAALIFWTVARPEQMDRERPTESAGGTSRRLNGAGSSNRSEERCGRTAHERPRDELRAQKTRA